MVFFHPFSRPLSRLVFSVCLLHFVAGPESSAETFRDNVEPLLTNSCLGCHDSGGDNGLDLESLDSSLQDRDTFRVWEKVYDRVRAGEMPPASEERPNPEEVRRALEALDDALRDACSKRQQRVGRVPARRLTKLELGYTFQDLLGIDALVTSNIPDEVESGSFDTVGANQRISAVHMESYLAAADKALNHAIQIGQNPYRTTDVDLSWLDEWHEKPLQLGGSITRRLKYGPGIVLFRDIDYLTQFRHYVAKPGVYRLKAKVAAYQSPREMTAKLIVKDQSGGARLVLSQDVTTGRPQWLEVETFLQPGETPYLTFRWEKDFGDIFSAGGARNFKGAGLAILKQQVEGPLHETWPPPSTTELLAGLHLTNASRNHPNGEASQLGRSDEQKEQVTRVVRSVAPRLFRREVSDEELVPFLQLAEPAIAQGRSPIEVVKVPLRAMLSSPSFLMFSSRPGPLNDEALANRLSYFLWRSMLDEELFSLAHQGQLSRPEILREQVDRMLGDERARRFVGDFLGQWLRLSKVDATSPDEGLYPEFDELLGSSIPQEPLYFFRHLIAENLPLENLIDSDFAFVNRRLAEHYGIPNVEGQEFRKVTLSPESPRGGILTQAAVLKTTANGTTTSPVMRGNFVLTNFLGTPPSPPPPDVGSIEPDTRGRTTIREVLAAHREIESCNQCHREIDPPGFALECFDPIGGFREHYRISGGELRFGDFTKPAPPRQGRPVDSSGVTSNGESFEGIEQYKTLLLREKEQIARNFVSQLVVFATGGEIEFSDRDAIADLLDQTRADGFRIRDMIHQVVQSDLFLHQ